MTVLKLRTFYAKPMQDSAYKVRVLPSWRGSMHNGVRQWSLVWVRFGMAYWALQADVTAPTWFKRLKARFKAWREQNEPSRD